MVPCQIHAHVGYRLPEKAIGERDRFCPYQKGGTVMYKSDFLRKLGYGGIDRCTNQFNYKI